MRNRLFSKGEKARLVLPLYFAYTSKYRSLAFSPLLFNSFIILIQRFLRFKEFDVLLGSRLFNNNEPFKDVFESET